MDVFVARQPILDREKTLFAYELLFRSGETNGFPGIDGNAATTNLLSTSFISIGIDNICGGKIAFINFTEELIKSGIPFLFPKEKLMVEILEDVRPSEEILAACTALKEKGYLLALDDFVYSREHKSLIEMSDIIKIDFRLTPLDTIKRMVSYLKEGSCKLLAEKIETHEEFEIAKELGFDLFQGYFFAKPEILSGKDLSVSQLTVLQLLGRVIDSDFDVQALEKIISQDVSVSYKLIHYLNSPYFGRIQPISSIGQAISFLGEKGFRLFVSLIAMSQLAQDKPNELIRLSIIRARFLEKVALHIQQNSSEFFLLGLLSLIEAMLDKNKKDIFEKLPLSQPLLDALQEKKGDMYSYLRLLETYEAGNWVAFRYAAKRTGLESEKILEYYLEAIQWADSFTKEGS